MLDWYTEMLAAPDKAEYEPLVLTNEQARFVLNFYRLDPVTGRRVYRRGVFSRPKKYGKSPIMGALGIGEALGPVVFDGWDADGRPVGKPWSEVRTPWVQFAAVNEDQPLALETPVRTTNGWSTVGDLDVGDFVYGSDGHPVEVKRKTEVFTDRECYEVVFDDGETVVADSGHGWTVERKTLHGDRFVEETLTTKQILESKNHSKRRTIRIPVVPVHFPDADLPVDPWRLGFWLGDGCRNSGVHAIDWRFKDELEDIYSGLLNPWEELVFKWVRGNTGTMSVRRKKGMCPRGHDYTNDASNRGTYAGNPGCKACNDKPWRGKSDPVLPSMREALRDIGVLFNKHIPDVYLHASYEQRMALLQGLMDSDGMVTSKGMATFTNADRRLIDGARELIISLGFKVREVESGNGAWRLHFIPRGNEPVARFFHKVERCPKRDRPQSRYRRVREVRKVTSVPVRCIGIDNEDHLFQVGRGGVLTHNTRNAFDPLLEMVRQGPVMDYYDIDPMDSFVALPKGRIEYITAAGTSKEGQRPVFAALDQTESWTKSNGGVNLAAVIRRNLAGTGGTSIETPNAYRPGSNTVAEASFAYAQAIAEGRARDDGLYLDHQEAPASTEMSDEDSLREGLLVAYGDSAKENGGWVDLDRIIADIWDPATDPQDARQYFLNQVTHASDSWLSSPEILNIVDTEKVVNPGDTIVLGFDGSRGRSRGKADATALVGMRVEDKHLFEIAVWEKQPHDPQDWQPNPLLVDSTVRDVFERFNVVGFYADPSGWTGQVAAWEAAFSKKLKVKASRTAPIAAWPRGKDSRVGEYVEQMRQAVVNSEISMSESPRLIGHMLNARRRSTRSGYLLYKQFPESPDKIDAAYAAVMAYKACIDAVSSGVGVKRKKKRRKAVVL